MCRGKKLTALTALIAPYQILSWYELPLRENWALDADSISIGIAYDNGNHANVSNSQNLPPEWSEAFRQIKEFLAEMDRGKV